MKENVEKTNDLLLSNIMIGFLENDRIKIDFNHTILLDRYNKGLVSLEDINTVYSFFIEQ